MPPSSPESPQQPPSQPTDRPPVDGLQAIRDRHFMRKAIDQAHNAWTLGEVPVGAVLVREDKIIATGFNHPIGMHDPTAHAEIRALRAGAQVLGNYRMPDCELFVTLEPCAMCAGAIQHARISRLVYGAPDPKTGAAGSVLDLFSESRLNHHTRVEAGLEALACGDLLRDFFAERRRQDAERRAEQAREQAASDSLRGIEVSFDDDPD